MARRRFPGAQNNLDSLCRRFRIDNSKREKHGALIDSYLLAEVYVELLGGRQQGMQLAHDKLSVLSDANQVDAADEARLSPEPAPKRPRSLPSRLSAEDRQRHRDFIKTFARENST